VILIWIPWACVFLSKGYKKISTQFFLDIMIKFLLLFAIFFYNYCNFIWSLFFMLLNFKLFWSHLLILFYQLIKLIYSIYLMFLSNALLILVLKNLFMLKQYYLLTISHFILYVWVVKKLCGLFIYIYIYIYIYI